VYGAPNLIVRKLVPVQTANENYQHTRPIIYLASQSNNHLMLIRLYGWSSECIEPMGNFRFGTLARSVSDPRHTMSGCEINRQPSKLEWMQSFPADLDDAFVRAGLVHRCNKG
jgi:hypothetical protein